MPMMLVTGVAAFYSFTGMMSSDIYIIARNLTHGIIQSYACIVIASLYKTFIKERQQGISVHVQNIQPWYALDYAELLIDLVACCDCCSDCCSDAI